MTNKYMEATMLQGCVPSRKLLIKENTLYNVVSLFQDAKMQLEQYRLDRMRWQKESRKASTRLTETGEITDVEKANLQKTLEDGRKEQEKVLLQALGIKLHCNLPYDL